MGTSSNTIQKQTKNSMPSFATGTFTNLQKLYNDGKLNAPAFCFVKDENADEYMAFLDSKGTWHRVLIERISEVESQLSDLVDPTTGETIKVSEYVEEKTAPIEQGVSDLNTSMEQVQKSISMITSIGGDS